MITEPTGEIGNQQGDIVIAPSPIVAPDQVVIPEMKISGDYVTVTFPCQSINSPEGVIRASGMETSSDPQIAKSIARTMALEELASKIEITVNSAVEYLVTATTQGGTEDLSKNFKKEVKTTVNQTIKGYKIICEEYKQNAATGKYQCFIAVEVSQESVLKPVYEELKKDNEVKRALPSFDNFRRTVAAIADVYEKTQF
jgi:putative lipoic acid-binding regulatory protein